MRTSWLVFTVLSLLVPGLQPDARGQPRPRPGTSRNQFNSAFGPRSLGFPVNPRPWMSADYGIFGPRANFGRGFSAARSYTLWDDFPPEPASRSSIGAVLGRPAEQGVQVAGERQPAIDQSSELFERTGPDARQSVQGVGQGQSLGEAAPQPGVPLAGAAQPGEPSSQPQALADGMAAASPAPRPRFQWSTDSIRALPAESILADRLRAALGNRLRSPIEVTIRQETATLRGVAASPRDRLLAGHLARFEPGVREVKNELTVAASPPGN